MIKACGKISMVGCRDGSVTESLLLEHKHLSFYSITHGKSQSGLGWVRQEEQWNFRYSERSHLKGTRYTLITGTHSILLWIPIGAHTYTIHTCITHTCITHIHIKSKRMEISGWQIAKYLLVRSVPISCSVGWWRSEGSKTLSIWKYEAIVYATQWIKYKIIWERKIKANNTLIVWGWWQTCVLRDWFCQ